MPDHWHGLLELHDDQLLANTVKQAKGRSARQFNLALERQGSVWRDGYHERAIRNSENLRGAARYLIANPLRAGLVDSLDRYPFWDAFWVSPGMDCPIPD
jgi:REP element-mobilizing transposase RayT